MTELEITRCKGEGMGTCKGCGTWTWMALLFDVTGCPGPYCSGCVHNLITRQATEQKKPVVVSLLPKPPKKDEERGV